MAGVAVKHCQNENFRCTLLIYEICKTKPTSVYMVGNCFAFLLQGQPKLTNTAIWQDVYFSGSKNIS